MIPLLDKYPDEIIIKKDTCIPMSTAALSTIAKIGKQTKCPSVDEWTKKMWYVSIREWLLSHKKEQEHVISYVTYLWNLKYDTNGLIYETETDSQT